MLHGDNVNVITDTGLIAYGDSLTTGSLAVGNNGYAQQLAPYIGGTSLNYALGSSRSSYSANKALQTLPEGYRRPVVSWMAGLNDIRQTGMLALPKIEGNLRAFLAACFLRDACPASKMKRTGTWTALSAGAGGKASAIGGTGLYCTNTANKLEWTFYGDNVVVGGILVNGGSGTYQDLEISIDGGAWTLFDIFVPPDAEFRYDAKIFTGLGLGIHTVAIRPVTANPYTVVDYVGTLTDPLTQSPVFVSEIPYLLNWAQYNSVATQAICDAANQVINDVVAEFAGYEIEVVKVNDFYDPTVAGNCASDGIHPTSQGHGHILDAFKDKITLV